MALLKNTDFEQAVEDLGLVPQVNTAVWLKVGITPFSLTQLIIPIAAESEV